MPTLVATLQQISEIATATKQEFDRENFEHKELIGLAEQEYNRLQGQETSARLNDARRHNENRFFNQEESNLQQSSAARRIAERDLLNAKLARVNALGGICQQFQSQVERLANAYFQARQTAEIGRGSLSNDSELDLARLAAARKSAAAQTEKYRGDRATIADQLARLDSRPAPIIVVLDSNLVI